MCHPHRLLGFNTIEGDYPMVTVRDIETAPTWPALCERVKRAVTERGCTLPKPDDDPFTKQPAQPLTFGQCAVHFEVAAAYAEGPEHTQLSEVA